MTDLITILATTDFTFKQEAPRPPRLLCDECVQYIPELSQHYLCVPGPYVMTLCFNCYQKRQEARRLYAQM